MPVELPPVVQKSVHDTGKSLEFSAFCISNHLLVLSRRGVSKEVGP